MSFITLNDPSYDSNLSSRIVFRDISKSFDCVDLSGLLFGIEIQQLGVMVGCLLNLLSSYLSQRSQVIF